MKTKLSIFVSTLLSLLILIGITPSMTSAIVSMSTSENLELDVRNLQSCLSKENASLDVLILMDSSLSLRDYREGDPAGRQNKKGSDNDGKRWGALRSSLLLLLNLSQDADAEFKVGLQNFGKKGDPKLAEFSQPWTSLGSDSEIDDFINSSKYDSSQGTDWEDGLNNLARKALQERLNNQLSGDYTSCQILFWFTDGEPNPAQGVENLCSGANASINWFREKNVLLLGGLLLPTESAERDNAIDKFSRVVEGERGCGENRPTWTKGKVVEAKTASDLAWEFVSLIAGIKNLVNLNAAESNFEIDPGTGHIEIYLKNYQSDWSIQSPDGAIYCSSDSVSPCEFSPNPETGVATIFIYPKENFGSGPWTITPPINNESDLKVYGGISTRSELSSDLQIIANGPDADIDEGKPTDFSARVVDSNGNTINVSDFEEIQICAKIESGDLSCAISGADGATLNLSPTLLDSVVTFEATVKSKIDPDRAPYTLTTDLAINVIDSGRVPTLYCVGQDKGNCTVERLANYTDASDTELRLDLPENSSSFTGEIFILEPEIYAIGDTSGDYTYDVEVLRENQPITFGKNGTTISIEDELILRVSNLKEGQYQVQIPYLVVVDGETYPRKLIGELEVGADENTVVKFLLLFLAYLLTLGLPYLYLLLAARRAAKIVVPDQEIAYLVTPVAIQSDGTLVNKGDSDSATFHGGFRTPSHEKLFRQDVGSAKNKVTIENATIEVIPPKWNPFVNPKTIVSIPGYLLISSAGGGQGQIRESETTFSPSLVGEAILYFSQGENLDPVTKTETITQETGRSIFADSSSVSETTTELVAKTGEVNGNAIFIISPFGNRIRSLEELTLKITSNWDRESVLNQLQALRESALQNAQTHSETKVSTIVTSVSNEEEYDDFSTTTKKSKSLFDDSDDWLVEDNQSKPKSLWDDENDNDSGTGSKRSLWDD